MVTNKQIRFLIKQWGIDVIIDIQDSFPGTSVSATAPKSMEFEMRLPFRRKEVQSFHSLSVENSGIYFVKQFH